MRVPRPEFQVVTPLRLGNEPREGVVDRMPSLDRVVHRAVRLDVKGLIVQNRTRLDDVRPGSCGTWYAPGVFRFQRAPSGVGVHRVLEHETVPDGVDFGVCEDRRQRRDQRLVKVGFIAVARQRFVIAVQTVELRSALAQPAERPRVLCAQLMVDAPQAVPRRLLACHREVERGTRGKCIAEVSVDVKPLEAAEKVQLVPHNRSANRTAPFLLADVGFLRALGLREEVPVGHRLARVEIER